MPDPDQPGNGIADPGGHSLDSPNKAEHGLSAGPRIVTGKTVGIVANRGSGKGASVLLVRRLARKLEKAGLRCEIAWTPDERRGLVQAARPGSDYRCLVAVGGDGTVSALINEKPRIPITVLPAGTENLAAQHFGLKRDTGRLARTITGGRIVEADLGCVSGRRFLLMVGLGFDGDVVTRHHRSRVTGGGKVKPTHRAAYVEPILRSSVFYRFPGVRVEILDAGAEEVIEGTTVFVFNLPRYALGLPFAPDAQQDDGLLDLVVFRAPGPFQALYYLWRVFCRTHLNDPGVFHRRVRHIRFSAEQTVPAQIDGDPGGFLLPSGEAAGDAEAGHPAGSWNVEVIPRAIQVLTPDAPEASRLMRVSLARSASSR